MSGKFRGSCLEREFFQFLGKEVRDNDINDQNTYLKWRDDLHQLYIGLFKWELPSNIDMKKVEQWLLYKGSVAFFIDEYIGPMILPYVTQGPLNEQGNPTVIEAYGLNGYRIKLVPGSYVLIYDNVLQTINAPALDQYAIRLADVDKTLDVNVQAQKTPIVITAETESQLTSLKSAYRKYHLGEPVIAQVGNTIGTGITALRTDAPPIFLQLQAYKEMLLAEALTFIGVPNRGKPKAAQVISDEIEAVNGHVLEERSRRLITRQDAVDKINAEFGIYGIKISVDYQAHEFNYALNDNQVATPKDDEKP